MKTTYSVIEERKGILNIGSALFKKYALFSSVDRSVGSLNDKWSIACFFPLTMQTIVFAYKRGHSTPIGTSAFVA